MERDQLFVATVDWLENVARQPTEHELLLASGRLRLLLLDKQRLVDQVNRDRKFDIRYRICRTSKSPYTKLILETGPRPTFWAIYDGLSPDLDVLKDAPIESVPLQALMHERVMIYRGQDVTVRDLIDHSANVAGGVHAGKSRDDPRLQALDELTDAIMVGGMDAAIRTLRAIVEVVVAALRPLRDAIKAGD